MALDGGGADARLAKKLQQLPAGVVFAHQTYGQGPASEGGDVVDSVGATTGNHLGTIVFQYEDRGFPAHVGDLTVDVLVGHQIHEGEDTDPIEPIDQLEEP
jgi:hypothetical protein